VQRAVHNLDRYIAATQVGITIASLMLGGIGERTLEPIFNALFDWLGMPEKWQGVSRVGVATGMAYFIMTAMHVIIGELMPKSIALQKPEAVSLVIGRPMTFCAKAFAPLIWMLNGTGNFLLKLLGVHAAEGHQQVHSPEELDLLFTQAHEGGQLTETEREILHRVVKFSDLTAREVMVPRVEIEGIPVEMPRQDLAALIHGQPHTRTPVYHGSLDDVVGIAHLKDLVRLEVELGPLSLNGSTAGSDGRQNVAAPASVDGQMVNLMSIVREAPRVPETITIDKMLVEFKKRRQQMAIVIDEYGGTSGLITMGDLLDQVFGDVHDEFDQPEPEIAPRADGRIQLAGSVRIDDVNELYSTGFRTDQVDTMAGLVLDELGRPAVVGDEVEVNGVNLRVEAIDRLRITTLSLLLPAEAE
jgi:CBS domain containing-hemolysin-like protein